MARRHAQSAAGRTRRLAGCWISAAVHMTLQPLCLGVEAPSSRRWRTPRRRVPLLATQPALCAHNRARAYTPASAVVHTLSFRPRHAHAHALLGGTAQHRRPLHWRERVTLYVCPLNEGNRVSAWRDACVAMHHPAVQRPTRRVLERYAACFGYSLYMCTN